MDQIVIVFRFFLLSKVILHLFVMALAEKLKSLQQKGHNLGLLLPVVDFVDRFDTFDLIFNQMVDFGKEFLRFSI